MLGARTQRALENLMKQAKPRQDRLDQQEWSRFWSRGTVTTFEGHFAGNYDGEIVEFWHSVLEPLNDRAVVVDLATGNGAVALLIAAWAREHDRQLLITGLDTAAIDPARVREARPELAADFDAIELIGGTPLEATGLERGSVDLLTSQYGYEYGDTAAGSREAARVLRAGGSLAMILHNADSAILRQAREGLAQVSYCLEEQRLVHLAERMVKLFRALKPGGSGPGGLHWSPGALKVRESFMDAAERVGQRAKTPAAREADAGFIEFLLPSVMQIVERSREPDAETLERAWAGLHAEVETYRLRMADLTSAALDAQGIERVSRELAEAGFENIEVRPLHYRATTLLGWTLTSNRA